MKIAIVHYWWLSTRGGEAVIKALIGLFPAADLFFHVYDEDLVNREIAHIHRGKIKTSLIAKIPFAKKYYQKYLPLMPFALEQLDLSSYDLIISSESGPAKGVITRPDALHICYCHSPMRYLWDLYPEYLRSSGVFTRKIFPILAHFLRIWDRISADRVDFFIANSRFVSSRISKFYRRESEVIFPPVNTSAFSCSQERDSFYLYLGQLTPYKRVDIAVDAFKRLNLRLVVIGEGEMIEALRAKGSSNISFLGRQPFEVIREHLEKCRGLIFPGIEDFGIVPVEAMASGAPVIAFRGGGLLDTILDNCTGIFFDEQTPESLIKAVLKIERGEVKFDPNFLKKHAEQFSMNIFNKKISEAIIRYASDIDKYPSLKKLSINGDL